MYDSFKDYKNIRDWLEGKDVNVKKQDIVDTLRRFANFIEQYTEDK